MMKLRIASLLIFLLALVPCSYGAVDVFVSIPPQKWLVKEVGEELVNVGILVKEGQNPHTFEPSPKQIAALSQAKVWFIMDMEFEHQLVRKISSVAPGLKIVDMTDRVQKHAMDESHDEHGHEEEKHAHGDEELDPHVWLSPENLLLMADTVADTLAAVDSENKAKYTDKLAHIQMELYRLDQELSVRLKPYKGASFYVFHPSFGYFAHSYDLVQEPVEVGGKSPTPRQLAELITKAKADKVKVIFVQPQFDPKSAQAIAQSIGGTVVPLDALAENVPKNIEVMARKIEAAMAQ